MDRRLTPLLAVALACACTSLEGLAGPAGPGSVDAGTCEGGLQDDAKNCGACGRACGEAEYCLAGTCAPGCPERTVYVSPSGSDDNSGCSRTAPKRTLAGAIALVKGVAAQRHEIHACRGVYRENAILLDYPVSLRGAYSCTTWERTATFGYPSFDPVNETVIEPDDATTIATLTVAGAVDDGTLLDGWLLRGRAQGDGPSSALRVTDKARARLRDNRVIGGGTAGAPQGSIGLLIEGYASPEVTRNSIDGGSGTTNVDWSMASIGVLLSDTAGPARLVGNAISGGSGRSLVPGFGSLGVVVRTPRTPTPLTGESAIEGNTIHGGSGSTDQHLGSVGVYVEDAEVDLVGNRIEAGNGRSVRLGGTWGVFVDDGTRKVRLERNRIYGGEASSSTKAYTWTIGIEWEREIEVDNNFIHAGGRLTSPSFRAAGAGKTGAILRHNTLVGSTLEAGAIELREGRARVDGNLFIAPEGNGVALVPCKAPTSPTPATLDSFRNNAFITRTGSVVIVVAAETCSITRHATVSAAEAALDPAGGGAVATGNVRIAASCDGEPAGACRAFAACSSNVGCITSVLESWDEPSGGYDDLFGAGYKLRDGAPCIVTRSIEPTAAGAVMTDLFGTTRTDALSIGAHEHDGACQ